MHHVLGGELALLLLDALEELEANHVQQSFARGELSNLVLAELCGQFTVAREQLRGLVIISGAYTLEHLVPGHFGRICGLATGQRIYARD